MQIRIDAVPGETPPPETFVSMRVGDVQKQTRFENTRTYRFPEPSKEVDSFGRIEVFKRIGTLTVPLNHYRNGASSLEVPCSYPRFNKLCLNMAVLDGNEQFAIKDNAKKGYANKRISEAQQYLANFNLEDLLAEAMREVIRDRPDDPHKYLAEYVLKQRSDPDLIVCRFDELERLKAQVEMLQEGLAHSAQAPRPTDASIKPAAPTPFHKLASVGTWLGPKPIVEEPPKAPANFKRLASVGTWLMQRPQDDGLQKAPFEIETANTDPFPLRPSVGTWLMREAPDVVDRPWYYKERDAGEHTSFLKSLQKVISTKDDEVERLKAQIAMLQAGIVPSNASSRVPSPVNRLAPPAVQSGSAQQPPSVPSRSVIQTGQTLEASGFAKEVAPTQQPPELPSRNAAQAGPQKAPGFAKEVAPTPMEPLQPALGNFTEFYKSNVLPLAPGAIEGALAGFNVKAASAQKPGRQVSFAVAPQKNPTLANFSEFYKCFMLSPSGAIDSALANFGVKASSVPKKSYENFGSDQKDLRQKVKVLGAELERKTSESEELRQDLLTLTTELDKAVEELNASRSSSPDKGKRIPAKEKAFASDLRQKAQQALYEATVTGKLEEAMAKLKGDNPQDALVDCRQKAQQALHEAASNGKLNEILRSELTGNGEASSMTELRKQAQIALHQAAQTGKLNETVAEVIGGDSVSQDAIAELRSSAKQALCDAASSGKLTQTLAEMKGKSSVSQDVTFELRAKAKAALSDAALTGKLRETLVQIKGESSISQEAESTGFQRRASVGTWLQPRPIAR